MWIDAICINQAETEERNAQVSLMREIYEKAERVVVWIGEEAAESNRAMSFLKEMARNKKWQSRHHWIDGVRQGSDTSSELGKEVETGDRAHIAAEADDEEVGSGGSEQDESHEYGQQETDSDRRNKLNDRLSGRPSSAQEGHSREGHIIFGFPVLYDNVHQEFFNDGRLADWKALDALLARPWCSRTWVVQEVWNASDCILQCGDASLKWKTFEKAMDYQEAWDDMGDLVVGTSREKDWMRLKRRYSLAIHISKKRLLGSTLSDLLWNTWDRESADPRDKVFAILGLVGDQHVGLMRPDYSKTMNRIFSEAARDIIYHEKKLDILLAAIGLARRDGLPSWVPDWRSDANSERPTLFVNRSRRFTLYTSGSIDAVIVHGHGYSASGDLEPLFSFDNDLSTLRVSSIIFDSVCDLGQAHPDEAGTEEILQDACRVVKYSGRAKIAHGTLSPEVKTVLATGSVDKTADKVLETVMKRRRFFITQRGYMAVGPAQTELGDHVCIIAGCNFPIVLRQVGDYYVLVGEAYGKAIWVGVLKTSC